MLVIHLHTMIRSALIFLCTIIMCVYVYVHTCVHMHMCVSDCLPRFIFLLAAEVVG